MEISEDEIKRVYSDLSLYFLSLEEPRKDPEHGKFEKIYVNTENLAKEFCKREKPVSLIVQEFALTIWERYKNNPELKAKCCRQHYGVTFADVYDYCRHLLNELGIESSITFKKYVKSAAWGGAFGVVPQDRLGLYPKGVWGYTPRPFGVIPQRQLGLYP